MSRSYKKAIFKIAGNPCEKHEANSVVRRREDMASNKFYRKCYQYYNICDFCWDARFEKKVPDFNGTHRMKKFGGAHQYWMYSK